MTDTTPSQLEAALSAASSAATACAARTIDERARMLRALADRIDADADGLVPIAQRETHLPTERLTGELARTTGQLHFLANVILDGHWLDASIDTTNPATPGIRPIQPDIGHLGGILETRKLAATAETHHMLVAPHNVGGPVLTAANLHLAACTPNFKIQEYFNDFADAGIVACAPGLPTVVDGHFPLPDGPGLGVTLDLDYVEAHPSSGAHLDLFAEGWHFRGGNRPEG